MSLDLKMTSFALTRTLKSLYFGPEEGSSVLKTDNGGGRGGGVHVSAGSEGEVMDREKNVRPRHHYSNSVDGSSILESIEGKKSMAKKV